MFTQYFLHHSKLSYIEKKQLVTKLTKTTKTMSYIGNLEFALFITGVGLGLYYIHKNNKRFSETTRLVAAGIATHIVVDLITYLGDKLNTKVKVESFYMKKDLTLIKDVNYYFDKKFSHFKQTKQTKRKRNIGQKSLGHYLGDLHFRGIQAAMVFVVINSIIFYGLYKNLKYFFKEKFGLEGFNNFFFSAAIAQLVAMIFAFPLENIKTRMQASNFNYDSFFKYYQKLFKGKPWSTIFANFKNEYSGFVSHLVLYVVYESVTFAIYETLLKLRIFEKKGHSHSVNNNEDKINLYHVLFASSVSGLISAIMTNPIDVYQVNKQVNPKFSIRQLNKENIMLGMKERIVFITFLNICTFIFLETIGPGYYDVRLE